MVRAHVGPLVVIKVLANAKAFFVKQKQGREACPEPVEGSPCGTTSNRKPTRKAWVFHFLKEFQLQLCILKGTVKGMR